MGPGQGGRGPLEDGQAGKTTEAVCHQVCVKISPNIWALEITTCQRETDRDECISPGPRKPPNQDMVVCMCV